ncbi:MAG TPA: hypothetical protein VFC19_07615 [Candidatus Limnocylindrales bacterium]|nr:hypothetical protein [Candidatus Limnocylindrales bacterium]
MGRRIGRDKPIFMDASGRRRRLFTMIAAAAGVLMTTAVVILVAGFVGPSAGHLPGLPDLQPAQQQEVAKLPQPEPGDPTTAPPRAGNGSAPAIAPSTSDTRGNGNGNIPTSRPDHPHPTKTK